MFEESNQNQNRDQNNDNNNTNNNASSFLLPFSFAPQQAPFNNPSSAHSSASTLVFSQTQTLTQEVAPPPIMSLDIVSESEKFKQESQKNQNQNQNNYHTADNVKATSMMLAMHDSQINLNLNNNNNNVTIDSQQQQQNVLKPTKKKLFGSFVEEGDKEEEQQEEEKKKHKTTTNRNNAKIIREEEELVDEELPFVEGEYRVWLRKPNILIMTNQENVDAHLDAENQNNNNNQKSYKELTCTLLRQAANNLGYYSSNKENENSSNNNNFPLREGQAEVTHKILRRESVLVVMPTGHGKSLTYQLPLAIEKIRRNNFLYQEMKIEKENKNNNNNNNSNSNSFSFAPFRFGIVVSPLIALMQDQVSKINSVGYLKARAISSVLSAEGQQKILDSILAAIRYSQQQLLKYHNNNNMIIIEDDERRHDAPDLLFLAPERLVLNTTFRRFLSQAKGGVAFVAFDEAHCLSEWGHDFRPSYRYCVHVLKQELAVVVNNNNQQNQQNQNQNQNNNNSKKLYLPPILALTATASTRVVSGITDTLRLLLFSGNSSSTTSTSTTSSEMSIIVRGKQVRKELQLDSVSLLENNNNSENQNQNSSSKNNIQIDGLSNTSNNSHLLRRWEETVGEQCRNAILPALVYVRTQNDAEHLSRWLRENLNTAESVVDANNKKKKKKKKNNNNNKKNQNEKDLDDEYYYNNSDEEEIDDVPHIKILSRYEREQKQQQQKNNTNNANATQQKKKKKKEEEENDKKVLSLEIQQDESLAILLDRESEFLHETEKDDDNSNNTKEQTVEEELVVLSDNEEQEEEEKREQQQQSSSSDSDSENNNSNKPLPLVVRCYHAGLSFSDRQQIQKQFMKNEVTLLVATVAFGMGIDKSDVRTVVHASTPPSVENYIQEVGRAGRDGKPSFGKLVFNTNDFFEVKRSILSKHLSYEQVYRYCHSFFIGAQPMTNTGGWSCLYRPEVAIGFASNTIVSAESVEALFFNVAFHNPDVFNIVGTVPTKFSIVDRKGSVLNNNNNNGNNNEDADQVNTNNNNNNKAPRGVAKGNNNNNNTKSDLVSGEAVVANEDDDVEENRNKKTAKRRPRMNYSNNARGNKKNKNDTTTEITEALVEPHDPVCELLHRHSDFNDPLNAADRCGISVMEFIERVRLMSSQGRFRVKWGPRAFVLRGGRNFLEMNNNNNSNNNNFQNNLSTVPTDKHIEALAREAYGRLRSLIRSNLERVGKTFGVLCQSKLNVDLLAEMTTPAAASIINSDQNDVNDSNNNSSFEQKQQQQSVFPKFQPPKRNLAQNSEALKVVDDFLERYRSQIGDTVEAAKILMGAVFSSSSSSVGSHQSQKNGGSGGSNQLIVDAWRKNPYFGKLYDVEFEWLLIAVNSYEKRLKQTTS